MALNKAQKQRRMAWMRTAMMFAGSGPWNPLQLGSSLKGYWNADDLATGAVVTWTDRKSGIAPTQPVGGQQPVKAATSFNSAYGGVTFDGIDDWLNTTTRIDSLPNGSGAGWIAALVSPSTTGTATCPFGYGGTAANTARRIIKSAGDVAQINDATTTNTSGISAVGPHVIIGHWFNTTENGWIDGTAFSGNPTTIAALNTSTVRLAIGANNVAVPAQIWPGVARHILVGFSNSFPDNERFLVEGWLAWEGGIQANLPAGHPYKLRRP